MQMLSLFLEVPMFQPLPSAAQAVSFIGAGLYPYRGG